MPCLDFAFFNLNVFFSTISRAKECTFIYSTFIYSFIIGNQNIFCNLGHSFDFSTWNTVIEKCFYVMKSFLIQKQYINWYFSYKVFSTRIVKYFSATRIIFCISSMMALSTSRFRVKTNSWFCNIFLCLLVCMRKVKSYLVETHHFCIFFWISKSFLKGMDDKTPNILQSWNFSIA